MLPKKEKVIYEQGFRAFYGKPCFNAIYSTSVVLSPYYGKVTIYIRDGKVHREDGPAKIWDNNLKEYFLFNRQVSKKEHEIFCDFLKLKGIS